MRYKTVSEWQSVPSELQCLDVIKHCKHECWAWLNWAPGVYAVHKHSKHACTEHTTNPTRWRPNRRENCIIPYSSTAYRWSLQFSPWCANVWIQSKHSKVRFHCCRPCRTCCCLYVRTTRASGTVERVFIFASRSRARLVLHEPYSSYSYQSISTCGHWITHPWACICSRIDMYAMSTVYSCPRNEQKWEKTTARQTHVRRIAERNGWIVCGFAQYVQPFAATPR